MSGHLETRSMTAHQLSDRPLPLATAGGGQRRVI